MKKKKEDGFTLIEMMIVLLVISVLLIITIPNITKNNSEINNKGCQAFIKMVYFKSKNSRYNLSYVFQYPNRIKKSQHINCDLN
ncbi:competence type IV pilus major pilin ComGC [Cytobacillus horneckiae]|uniref:competence type IV pilus major pilin ComGC n=1 Tax=Cytobacillus horneckiae TaxID=549687 RepID=UPI0034CFF29A